MTRSIDFWSREAVHQPEEGVAPRPRCASRRPSPLATLGSRVPSPWSLSLASALVVLMSLVAVQARAIEGATQRSQLQAPESSQLSRESTLSETGVDFSSWRSGADGYKVAERSRQLESSPMLVYFYTDWCGYCRQFETELLREPELATFLERLVTVRVNPESGPAERGLAMRYRVSSFPSLFVHSGESGAVSPVERTLVDNGRRRLMTPREFIAELAAAASR